MWIYEKKLQYPVKISQPNAAMAKVIISQLGGPHGELGAATRYLSQRYSMPYDEVIGILTDVGTEELAHKIYQLQRDQRAHGLLIPLHKQLEQTNSLF